MGFLYVVGFTFTKIINYCCCSPTEYSIS